MFSYTVRCTFKDKTVADSWLQWLEHEHIQDVLDAGASSAEIFQIDNEQTYEIRYRFGSKSDFEAYERDHAPRLRVEGLQKFPIELGLDYSRGAGQSLSKFNC